MSLNAERLGGERKGGGGVVSKLRLGVETAAQGGV